MKTLISSLVLLPVLIGCAELNELVENSETGNPVCFVSSGSTAECREFDSRYTTTDIENACTYGTLGTDTRCPVSHDGATSWGKCTHEVNGWTTVYRFYYDNLLNEQVQCDALSLWSGTSTWDGDIF